MSSANPIGQDSWNRSKESREHPELNSSGHGTIDRPWSTDTNINKQENAAGENDTKPLNKKEKTAEKEHSLGGHTRKREYLPRSVKRDLNNI